MSDSRLLPTGSSPLEVAAAKACAEIEKTPVSIRELWNPDTCPANLLPWLAWSFSVDRWDDKWPEATKRAVIRDAYFIHCHKGTIGAIRRVVEPLGYLIEVREWWQLNEEPGTFRIVVGVLEQGITEEMYQELERLVADAKPASRHLTGLAISLSTTGNIFAGAGCYHGDALTVLLAVVRNALNGEDVRPVADRVTVQSAAIVEYQINATLYLYPGPESEPIRAAAVKKLEAYITAQHRLGRDIRLSAIYAALHVEGVQRVELAAPLADIVLNSTQASFCTEYRVVTGGSDE
ncbi:phage tail protein I [Escherichia coli]|nr:phage tail protein I [Escherichia coli]